MQYILTEDEYENLIPRKMFADEFDKVVKLNEKVLEYSGYPCGKGSSNRSVTFYCDHCPIGAFGTKTCTKRQQYSK